MTSGGRQQRCYVCGEMVGIEVVNRGNVIASGEIPAFVEHGEPRCPASGMGTLPVQRMGGRRNE